MANLHLFKMMHARGPVLYTAQGIMVIVDKATTGG